MPVTCRAGLSPLVLRSQGFLSDLSSNFRPDCDSYHTKLSHSVNFISTYSPYRQAIEKIQTTISTSTFDLLLLKEEICLKLQLTFFKNPEEKKNWQKGVLSTTCEWNDHCKNKKTCLKTLDTIGNCQ